MLELRGIAAGYGGTPVLREVSFTVPKGSLTALIGPNGCGKTTLLRAAARQLPLLAGEILLDGRPVSSYGRTEFARKAAFMPQVRSVPAITAGALVAHGRFPHLGFSRRLRPEDRAAVQAAMEATGVADWANRDLRALSGGERQRVYLAMALAQDTDLILLDEPTTYLDPGRQFELLDLIASLPGRGKTVVMVLHDLSHALRYSTQLVLLEQGRLVQRGTPEELYAGGQLDRVFGIRSRRAPDGSYYFLPPFA
ncbi:MAG: ABC transporter ATP-binding protein [Dysosmobacter sp.]|nr:ABC transporter ATP-binding protein [Dysosmobacter sp.]